MTRLRKVFIRDKTYFITFRTEEGLLLPATPLIKRILEGIFCKAKALYPIDVNHFNVMANHMHLAITVLCPESVDDFIMYVKRESAHAINRLLGRRKRTIWCAGYDSPIVLDLKKLIDIIAYIYANPCESDISDTIEDYSGLSSWQMFVSGNYEMEQRRLSRAALPMIGEDSLPISTQERLINELEEEALEANTFVLSPYAFMKSFQVEHTEEELKEMIISEVIKRQDEFRRIRKKALPRKVKLMTSPINLSYRPKKFGKRMICHSSEKELRVEYIAWFKDLCKKAADIYRRSKNKIAEMILPPGIFSPGGALTANLWFPPG